MSRKRHCRENDSLKIALATKNPGKTKEIHSILEGLPIELVCLHELSIGELPPEDGLTFEENALKKARFVSRMSGLTAIADDSGLEVDALGGRPGVYSARYGGGTDEQRYLKLLEELEDIPEPERTARFRCVIALVSPGGVEKTFEGVLEGRITTAPRGDHGFGYDPVFCLPDKGKTLAEMPPEEKNLISHRAKALRKLRAYLLRHPYLT